MRPDQQRGGALSVLQAHVTEYEFDGEIASAVADLAEYIAANDELISAREALAQETKWGIESAVAAVGRAEKRHALAHARMKGEK
jgi:hypothetical protein